MTKNRGALLSVNSPMLSESGFAASLGSDERFSRALSEQRFQRAHDDELRGPVSRVTSGKPPLPIERLLIIERSDSRGLTKQVADAGKINVEVGHSRGHAEAKSAACLDSFQRCSRSVRKERTL